RSACSRLIVSRTSMPSCLDPCSQMSSTTSCGRRVRMADKADSESPATRVVYPSSVNIPEIRSRISSSSSTMRISDAISDPFLLIFRSFFTLLGYQILLGKRKSQSDLGAAFPFHIGQGDVAAMVLHDLAHDGEAQTRALGARGDIGLGEP